MANSASFTVLLLREAANADPCSYVRHPYQSDGLALGEKLNSAVLAATLPSTLFDVISPPKRRSRVACLEFCKLSTIFVSEAVEKCEIRALSY